MEADLRDGAVIRPIPPPLFFELLYKNLCGPNPAHIKMISVFS